MKALEILPFVVSPLSLAAVLAVCVGSLVGYASLRKRWKRPGIAKLTCEKELAVFVLAVISSLLLVAIGDAYTNERLSEARMRAEVDQRTAMAAEVRGKITSELEAARAILITRTQQKIAEGKIDEAKGELTRYVSLQDPQIVQAIALIDTELEIRKLLEQSRSETAPEKLSAIFSRLADLAPGTPAYKESAALYSAAAQKDKDARAAPANTAAQ